VTPGEVIQRYLTAMRAGDWETGLGYYADDIVFRVPGRSELAGERRGRAAAREYLETAFAKAHDGDVEVELVDMLVSEERVALIVNERFGRPEGVVEIRRANVYRVKDDRIVEIWIFEGDQYEVDALFAS
jgi:uncharacterized protein